MYTSAITMSLFSSSIFGKNCKMNLHASLSDWYLHFIKMEKSNVIWAIQASCFDTYILFFICFIKTCAINKISKMYPVPNNDVMNILFFFFKYTKVLNKAGDANSSLNMFTGWNVLDFLYMNHASDIHKCPHTTTSLCHSITNENINKL